jgi:hypothetical protein
MALSLRAKGVFFSIFNEVSHGEYLGLGLLEGLTAERILHFDERVRG